jgi:GT2 family glycosyltransferase
VTHPIPLRDGQFTVPGNRWDLVDTGRRTPSVAVVIPYYNQQRELDLVLRALELQQYPRELLSVIVADDGSSMAPDTDGYRMRVQVVRQPDQGFRAAAVRNLGARAADAEILCFLDADTVPEPAYVQRIVALPAVVPDALVVGRRRHADLSVMTPEDLHRWWAGDVEPVELTEPAWLREEYERSGNLLRLDHRSYRYIISSVMCCSTALFDELGGFDESFTEYGGEDWEFAHRARACGAVLQHAPDAVAWHDGPDWADRSVADRRSRKNSEALALARRITDPDARTHGLCYALPDVAVRVATAGHTAASLLRTLGCFLHEDVGIWVDDPALVAPLGADDPRIHCGDVPDQVLRRCRFVVDVTGRAVLPRPSVTEILRRCAAPGVGEVRVRCEGAEVRCRTSWSINRARRWALDPARISSTLEPDAGEAGLCCGEPVPDLSW